MKIGIIGSGIVGRVLGKAFLTEGHEVMMGSRNPAKEEVLQWRKDNPEGQTGKFDEAAKFGELLVLATAGSVVEDAIRLADVHNFDNKTVIDSTNPIAAAPPVNGVLKFFTNYDESLMEKIAKLIPGAKLVKAFNSVGNAVMYKPALEGGEPSMFICGDDAGAKKIVTGLLANFGYEAEDMGSIEAARAIEPLCILWCIPGFLRNQWGHSFKLLKTRST